MTMVRLGAHYSDYGVHILVLSSAHARRIVSVNVSYDSTGRYASAAAQKAFSLNATNF